MSKTVNTSALQPAVAMETDSSKPVLVDVQNVTMVFNMANEKYNNLKEYAIALFRHELHFKEFRALDNVSFSVRKGDVFGILGTNGSGKSTVLKIIAGVLNPSEGNCQVRGNIAPLIELGAGFDMDLTARENVYLNGALLGYSQAFMDEHFDSIVRFAEVEDFLDIPMKNYSSGMVSRIAFSIATMVIPDILIVDEVLSVGDFAFQMKCENRIKQLINEHGVTVLLVSHSTDQVARLCNRAVWIEKGHLRLEGNAQVVCNAYRVLGGRKGSRHSEQIVFQNLIESEEDEREFSGKQRRRKNRDLAVFDGDNIYELASKLCLHDWVTAKEKPSRVILTNCFCHVFTIALTSLAGRWEAPILPILHHEIPKEIEYTLRSLQPSFILLFTEKEDYAQDLLSALSSIIDAEIEVLVLNEMGAEQFCYSLLERDFSPSDNGQIGVVLDFENNCESFALAPFIYRMGCPVVIAMGEPDVAAMFSQLKRVGVKRVVAAGEILSKITRLKWEEAGFELIAMEGETQDDRCREIFGWTLETMKDWQGQVVVASRHIDYWQELHAVAPFASNNRAALYLADFFDLDSTAACLNRIREGQFSNVSVLSVNGVSDLDCQLLENAFERGCN